MICTTRTSLLSYLSACLLALCVILFAESSQRGNAQPAPGTVQALFVSDIHFEPFWDPAKAAKLAAAPATGWKDILAAPDSPSRQQDFNSLQSACKTRGTDTSFPVLQASMTALSLHSAGAKFVTLSGDLMAHAFDCKFKTVLPKATATDYRAFAVKTIQFVISQLQAAAPGIPVYTALGNNDSDCGDYKLDANSDFLKAVGQAVTQNFPAGERDGTLASFSQSGSYSVELPAPLERTRLIVLDDLFFSAKHTACSGQPDTAAQDALYTWLASQLEAAREANQKAWIMAHIAPGVDAYSTLSRASGPCATAPKMLLSSDRLAQELMESDVVRLGIFGHTHEDEIKLLVRGGSANGPNSPASAIPVKLVAAISPINGNLPSFTVAQIDPATSTLVNYQVITGSDKVNWKQQYDYRAAYNEESFSGAAITDLVAKFTADTRAATKPSQDYIHNFSIGNPVPLLSLVWPGYVCTMAHQTATDFSACACAHKTTSGNQP